MKKLSSPDFLARARELAARGEGHTRPNPPVGAVIVRAGKIIGEGWHKRCGGPHAEVAALADAARRGNNPKGATVYVTLEPCSKPGRVGACTDALIAAGVKEVIWGTPDPNPVNRGRAARVLGRAGISGRCVHDGACAELIAPFATFIMQGRPFVTVKIAQSLDGRICDGTGDARWVSSAKARRQTGLLRARADAILVGAETVRRDNPSLLSHGKRNDDLFRLIVSRSGKLPKDAQVFTDAAKDRTLVFDSPRAALDAAAQRGFLHVLCEGGLELARSLAAEGLVDEWICVLAPKVIGHNPIRQARKIARVQVLLDGAEGGAFSCSRV